MVAHPIPGMQPLAPPGPALPTGPPGITPLAPPGPAVPAGPPGMDPVAPSGPAAPPGPPGITPLAPPGPASPTGPPGMATLAPSGPAVPMLAHGVPSGFQHGGGAGSAPAIGENAMAAPAAPANKRGVIFVSFTIMEKRLPPAKPGQTSCETKVQAKRLVYLGGSSRMIWVIGAHGQDGTTARPFSFSIASTILRTPVSLSTISRVVADFAVISDSM